MNKINIFYILFRECEEICNCSCGEVIGGEVFPPFEGYVTLNSSGEEIIVGAHPEEVLDLSTLPSHSLQLPSLTLKEK